MTVRINPYSAFNFAVVSDKFAAGFMDCAGLDAEQAVIEYREGIDNIPSGGFVRKLPGLEAYPTVVLKRGLTGNTQLWLWRNEVRNALVPETGAVSQPYARNIFITLQDEGHRPVFGWTLLKAWPCKLSGPALSAQSNELAVEQLELCCERIDFVNIP